MFMETFVHDLWETMVRITKLFKEKSIDFIFIGGAAVNQYGYHYTTEDIDILVSRKDLSKLEDLPAGYIRSFNQRKYRWLDPKADIDVLYSGDRVGDGLQFIEPHLLGVNIDGVPVISLNKLIEYKLSAAEFSQTVRKYKDYSHILALIKHNKLHKNYGKNFRQDLRIKYTELWEQYNSAEKEEDFEE